LIGYLKVGLTRASLHLQLLDTRDFGKRDIHAKAYVEEETFTDMTNFVNTDSAEPFGEPLPLNAPADAFDFSKRTVRKRPELPRCTYHPDPSYTNAARTVKFQGSLLLRVVVSKEGEVPNLQVWKGLPFGLNKQALDTVSKWHCEPAALDGHPVAATVP